LPAAAERQRSATTEETDMPEPSNTAGGRRSFLRLLLRSLAVPSVSFATLERLLAAQDGEAAQVATGTLPDTPRLAAPEQAVSEPSIPTASLPPLVRPARKDTCRFSPQSRPRPSKRSLPREMPPSGISCIRRVIGTSRARSFAGPRRLAAPCSSSRWICRGGP